MTSKELFEKCKQLIPGGVNSPVRGAFAHLRRKGFDRLCLHMGPGFVRA